MSEFSAIGKTQLNVMCHSSHVIFFWYSGTLYCMLFTFENKSSAHVIWCISGEASFITIDEQLKNPKLLFP